MIKLEVEAFKKKDKDAIIVDQRVLNIKEEDCIPLDLEELSRSAEEYGIELD